TLVIFPMFIMEASNTRSSGNQQATPTIVRDPKNAAMVYVQSRTFRMGTTKDTIDKLCVETGPNETQSDQFKTCTEFLARGGVLNAYTVKVSPLWIDQYEVTHEQYQGCVDS